MRNFISKSLGWSGRENTTFSITRYELKYYDCLERVKLCEYLLNKYNAILENKINLKLLKFMMIRILFFI
ncbi:hypothetical protein [Spiroplasma endosymbiont of Phyllotreta cruciferae]|uniref:hypothetical protein n=1 Tax=Spiroplasma endosymbiont of Phyllotreta cruciferae TaxID=2886375 RepID=UPI00209F2172|nr:hypothetical protein [Spiroplasma endosymbiont of Phyllotreta cruciferae]